MHLLVLGGNSEIGLALARLWAQNEQAEVTLASRDLPRLEERARDLTLRFGVTARAVAFDATDYGSHAAFWSGLPSAPDVVAVCFGLLGDQKTGEADFSHAQAIISSNYLGAVSILEHAARAMQSRGSGLIIGISSVAGLRGRKSNYLYGSAKAGLIAYLSGLRHRLHASGVRVATVLPGFVRTKMTEGLDLPAALTASPEQAAQDIWRGVRQGRDVIYTRWMWKYIMCIIRLLPEALFKKTNL